MKRVFLRLFGVATAAVMATALLGAQALTNVVPTISSLDITVGGGSTGSVAITGSGFLTTPKGTRFVDAAGNDVFNFVSCSTASACSGNVRAGLKAPGQAGNIPVFAKTSGGTSLGSINFFYYGPPIVNNFTPSSGSPSGTTAFTINGAGFATNTPSFPGSTTMPTLGGGISSCSSTTQCSATTGAVPGGDFFGARFYILNTPGNSVTTQNWSYAPAPATPVIQSVSPTAGPGDGGNVITITGTGFIQGAAGAAGSVPRIGTNFVFQTASGSGGDATAVNCTSTTQCQVTVPAGFGGAADITVRTFCAANSTANGCNLGNSRASGSFTTTKTGAYSYFSFKVNPVRPPFGSGLNLYTSENGGTATFTVALVSQPTASVHVGYSNGSPTKLSASPAAGLDFTTTNWATPQTVTLTGLDDGPGIGNSSVSFTLIGSSSDPNYNMLTTGVPDVMVMDNDSKQIFYAPQTGLVTTRAGGTATFSMVLTQAPSAAVTVNLTSSDTTAGTLSASSLTFATTSGGPTGWNVPRSVTITGQNDGQVGVAKPYQIIVTVTSDDAVYGDSTFFWNDIFVTNQDAAPVITAHPSNQSVSTGAMATFTASATGSPAPTVRWQVAANNSGAPFVDVVDPSATTTTLSFPAQLFHNGRAYRAVFTNPGGSTATTAATLTVSAGSSPPVVTLHPLAALTVLNGQAIFLSANASGTPAPTAQWEVSTNGGGSWSNIFAATSFNLSFTTARADNGRLYRARFTNGSGSVTTNPTTLTVRLRVRSDIENDRKSDIVIWRPGSGHWFWLTSSSGFDHGAQGQKQWGSGIQNDIPISADMDGDGVMDLVVWRPTDGTFYWLTSSTGYSLGGQQNKQWGSSIEGDKPFVGDIDGDGKGDLIVWRPSSGIWFYLLSSTGYNHMAQGQNQWGNSNAGDVPMLSDMDGDGLADLTVWRASTGTWFWLKSSTGYDVNQFGQAQWGNNAFGDIPMVADMDGDGFSDLVVWRPTDGNFYWLKSTLGLDSSAPGVKAWGSQLNNDIPLLGDFDGDGKADLVIWRPASGIWFWLTSTSGYDYALQQQKQWGSSANADIPMLKGGVY